MINIMMLKTIKTLHGLQLTTGVKVSKTGLLLNGVTVIQIIFLPKLFNLN